MESLSTTPPSTAELHPTLHAVQNGLPPPPENTMDVMMAGTVIAILLIFFAPTLLAARGRRASVFFVNLFFGWTLIGWGIAMFMAVRSKEQEAWRRGEWEK